jgi:large subunit ribosomal protein L24
VQTTLLGLAIAIILALATALLAPLFIDWGAYRAQFEARASRLTGIEFRVRGPIDVRLLPTPILVMQGIEIARADNPGNVRARELRLEFALGALMRGEWRVSEARLDGPELHLGIDPAGHLDWSAPKLNFNPEGVSIERLEVQNGRAVLLHAASRSKLLLENLEFRGELRSLTGPLKGEGSFAVGGQRFSYRISLSRLDPDSGVKLRLALNGVERPLAAEADLSILLDRGIPRFEGNVQLARQDRRAPVQSDSPAPDPWHLASHVKGDAAAATFEQIDFQYGPEEGAIKWRGRADVTFAPEPRIVGELASPQIDLDRGLSVSDVTRRSPLMAAKAAAAALFGSVQMPIPANLSIKVEAVQVAGGILQRLAAVLEVRGEHLDLKKLEFRAPGVTQVSFQGNGATTSPALQIAGSTTIQTNDLRALLNWLAGRGDEQGGPMGAMHLVGNVALSEAAIAVEGLKLDLDGTSLAGRFAYLWARDGRPARVDAALSAPEIDVDRVHTLAAAMLGGTSLAWPQEGALSLKVGRASLLGLQAKQAEVNVRIDPDGLVIDPVSVEDFGGATLAVRGRINTKGEAPRGTLTLDLDARTLDGILVLAEHLAPQAAEELRRSAGRVTPVLLRSSVAIDPGGALNSLAHAKLKADGRAGPLRLTVLGDATGARDKTDKLAALAAAKINLMMRVESDDGPALIGLMKLDRFIAVEQRPATLVFGAKGVLDSECDLDTRLESGALFASATGKIHVSPRDSPSAQLNVTVRNANLRSPRPAAAGGGAVMVPVSLSARLDVSNATISLAGMQGTVAGSQVSGRLALDTHQPVAIDGDIELAAVDLPGVLATALGVPARTAVVRAESPPLWPTEPLNQMLEPVTGQVAVKASRVTVTPKLEVRDLRGVMHLGDSRIALQGSEGTLAGGRATGELILLRSPEGLVARTRVALLGAEAAQLLPGNAAISGRLRLNLNAEGTGRSVAALIGSLEGGGTFTLENAQLARIDPRAIEAAIRAVDQGLPVETNRLRDRVESALANGSLSIPRAEGAITVSAGQARVSNSMPSEGGNELALDGSVNLVDSDLDARLVLSATGMAGVSANAPPEIVIALKGPVSAPKRSIDVTAFASWLALRAVEQQSNKLDVLEGRETLPAPPTGQHLPEGAQVRGTQADKPPQALQRGPVRKKTSSGVLIQPAPLELRPEPPPFFFRVQ